MATHPPGTDPRRAFGEADIRPLVAPPPRGTPVWLIAGAFGLIAILLFVVLDSRRRTLTAPTTKVRATDAYERAAAPPATLFVPPEPAPGPIPTPVAKPTPAPGRPRPPIYYPPPGPPRVTYSPPPMSMPVQSSEPVSLAAADAPRRTNDNAVVFDVSQSDSAGGAASTGPNAPAIINGAPGSTGANARVRADVMQHRPTTVPQGTLIAAVLETALDSTRPGLARALVQRDVRGFDGSTVLIQRGSRLIGEYRADLQPGQNRASVMWTRLVRPDGVTIALASPAADTLGRGGIRGKVNSHFLARFGSAILQSTLDLGVNLASRVGNNNNNLVVGLPISQTPSLGNNGQVQPTLTVKQGTAIMVFVARDLDFTAVENRR